MRVGVIGLGSMGKNHARVIHELQDSELASVFDPLSSEIKEIYGVPTTDKLEDLLSSNLDYCVVSSPTGTHAEMALLLAEHGIPALIEKPIAASMPEGKKIIDAFAIASLPGGVGHIERFNPAVQGLKTQLENGLLGEVFQITTRRTGPFTGRIADVGVIKDLASHDIDLVSWIADSKYKSVDARMTHRSGRSHEDLLIAVATLGNGTVVNHLVNWLSPYKERVTTVLGEKGLLVADTLNTKLTYIENGLLHKAWDETTGFKGVAEGEVRDFELGATEPLRLEHLSFQSDIKAGKVIDSVSLAEGLEVLRVAELMVIRAESSGQIA